MPGSAPHVIGIAGASGSGKTALAHALAERLDERPSVILPLDAYYRDLSGISLQNRAARNFDEPAAIDWDLFRAHLDVLSGGRSIDRPVYDFATHTRLTETTTVAPAKFVIVEGLFALADHAVRRRMRTKVFIDAPDNVCLERRIARDTGERGRTLESVVRQYEETVRPMFERFIRPTMQYADVVVSGDRPMGVGVELVFTRVRAND